MKEVVNNFCPDFTAINNLIVLDGNPVNEFDLVKQQGQDGLLSDMFKTVDIDYDADINVNDDVNFASIIPKEVQSEVEVMDYMNYLKKSDKYE